MPPIPTPLWGSVPPPTYRVNVYRNSLFVYILFMCIERPPAVLPLWGFVPPPLSSFSLFVVCPLCSSSLLPVALLSCVCVRCCSLLLLLFSLSRVCVLVCVCMRVCTLVRACMRVCMRACACKSSYYLYIVLFSTLL